MLDIKGFDKQIYFVKVIVWESCPYRCKYCFVDKTNGNKLSFETLTKLIDFLLLSPWKNKLLHLLGGEPLLYFDIIKQWVLYARDLATQLEKDLDISFCTTGILFDEEKLRFIDEQKIYLAWSIDGSKEIHDLNRIDTVWNGSFDQIIVKKPLVFSHIQNTHLWIAMTIDENTSEKLFDSYKYLVDEEKFTCTINIAPVDGKIWKPKYQKAFIENLLQVYDYIFSEIGKGRYLYLNALNKEFRFNMLSAKEKGRCLWFYTEAFATWEIVFNPFVNKEEDYSKFVVGNINDEDFFEKIQKYIGCKFSHKSEQCIRCKESYFKDTEFDLKTIKMNKLLSQRDRISVFYANKIREKAQTDQLYASYIELAKDHMYV